MNDLSQRVFFVLGSVGALGSADLRTPKADGGCMVLLSTSGKRSRALDGLERPSHPPPCLLPSSLSNLSMSFQANVTHMSLNHSRSTCKGKGQEAQFDVAVRLFLLRRRVLALPTGRKWSLGILHATEKQSRKERHTGLPDPEQGRGKGREGCLPALLPAYSLGWSVRRLPCPGSQGQLGTSSCRPGLEANLLRYCSRKREGRFTLTSTQEPQRTKGKMEVQSPLSWLLLPEAASPK